MHPPYFQADLRKIEVQPHNSNIARENFNNEIIMRLPIHLCLNHKRLAVGPFPQLPNFTLQLPKFPNSQDQDQDPADPITVQTGLKAKSNETTWIFISWHGNLCEGRRLRLNHCFPGTDYGVSAS